MSWSDRRMLRSTHAERGTAKKILIAARSAVTVR